MKTYIKRETKNIKAEKWNGTDVHAQKLNLRKHVVHRTELAGHNSSDIIEWYEVQYYLDDKRYGSYLVTKDWYIVEDELGFRYAQHPEIFEKEWKEYELERKLDN